MNTVWFRFYAELNDFLEPERRYLPFEHRVPTTDTVKHVIESLGVPHTEVDLILVNGTSVPFSQPLEEGDRVSVYPVFESLDVRKLERLRPEPLRDLRFVLDGHLGRLAAYLRMLGFDTSYAVNAADPELARISAEENRVLLTRDVGLLKRSAVTRGYYVRSTNPLRQLSEVVQRFDLLASVKAFTRCLQCNALLEPVEKDAVAHRLPPRTRELYDDFRICGACGKIYWKGSHHRRMLSWIHALGAGPQASAE
jgi:uncharacterized protein with PIN domain